MIFLAIGLCAVIGIVLCILGINYLRSLDVRTSTVVLSLGIIFLLSFGIYFAIGQLSLDSLPSLISVPFGYAVRLFLLWASLPNFIAYLAGFVMNFLAFVGAVRWLEKRFGK
jgi:hypothetical protein